MMITMTMTIKLTITMTILMCTLAVLYLDDKQNDKIAKVIKTTINKF